MIPRKEPHLEITIVDGKIVIDGHDFEGQGCHELASLFHGLGEVEESKRKPDFFKGAQADGLRTIIR